MHRICSNTDGSKPLFFYMKIINNVKQDVDSNTNVTKGKILAIKRKKTKGRKTYYWPYIYKTPETGTGYKKEDI